MRREKQKARPPRRARRENFSEIELFLRAAERANTVAVLDNGVFALSMEQDSGDARRQAAQENKFR